MSDPSIVSVWFYYDGPRAGITKQNNRLYFFESVDDDCEFYHLRSLNAMPPESFNDVEQAKDWILNNVGLPFARVDRDSLGEEPSI